MKWTKGTVVVLALFAAGCGGEGADSGAGAQALAVDKGCSIAQTTCRANGARSLEVQLVGDIQPLVPFEMTARFAEAAGVRAVVVEFYMVGMDMGLNRYTLQPVADADGMWRGTVTLPVCLAGRADWYAEVRTETAEGRYLARFPFETVRR